MPNAWTAIKKEASHLFPVVAFFFVAFNLIDMTTKLLAEGRLTDLPTFAATTIGALVVGKVIMIADLLPSVDRFRGKPLIYNTLWKTGIYFVVSVVVRYLEHIVPLLIHYKSLALAHQHLLREMVWPRFWAVQIWLVVLLLVFVAVTELNRAMGHGKLRAMFFGR